MPPIRRALPAALAALAVLAPAPRAAAAAVVRATAEVAGENAVVEIVETTALPRERADEAARRAIQAMAQAEADALALAESATASPGRPLSPGAPAFELLVRADSFCRWSEGAIGALGGRVFRLWGFGAAAPGRPEPGQLAEAVASARCDALALDRAAGTFAVAPGSVLDLTPFELGWAVDRAASSLAAAGAASYHVRLGPIERGVGGGPDGKGWRVEFPALPGGGEPIEGFWLRDRSAAVLAAGDRPIRVGGDSLPRWLDLRRGLPTEGVAAVAAVTELAVDAEGVAWAMSALGPRYGEMSTGQLRPEPSVLWAMGSGEGPPLIIVARWSNVPKR
jgi:thiamine biosynthesis lipoprotein ApbE